MNNDNNWMSDAVFDKKLSIISNPLSCEEIYELQEKLKEAEHLLERAWDAGYETGKKAEQGYLYTESFEQWKSKVVK